MKKIFLGLSSALFVIGSVIGMDGRSETPRMTRSKSLPNIETELIEGSVQISRSHSEPVTENEIQAAITRWSHLVPDDDVKREINLLLPFLGEKGTKEKLVELLCSNSNEEYAHYASNVVADIFIDECEDTDKFGRMLDHISCDSIPRQPSVYWEFYRKEYYSN
jgi:hypothetical protein